MILLLRWKAWMDQHRSAEHSHHHANHDWESWMVSMIQSWILVFGIFHNMAGSFLMQQQEQQQQPFGQQQHHEEPLKTSNTKGGGRSRSSSIGMSPPPLKPLVDDHVEDYGDDDHSTNNDDTDRFPLNQDIDFDMIDIYNENI